jgi:hypothetical protein
MSNCNNAILLLLLLLLLHCCLIIIIILVLILIYIFTTYSPLPLVYTTLLPPLSSSLDPPWPLGLVSASLPYKSLGDLYLYELLFNDEKDCSDDL